MVINRARLRIYRGHGKACPHRNAGRKQDRCRCPWWIDGVIDGRRYNKSLRTQNRNVAEEKLRQLEIGEALDPQACPSLAEACESFLLDAQARELREPTLYKYRLLFKRLKSFSEQSGLHYVKDFGVKDLRRFRESWTYSAISANKKLEELRAFFQFCFESGWIAKNWARKLKPAKVKSPPRTPFSEDEIARILIACDQYPRRGTADPLRMRALICVMLEIGLRIGDAVQLRRTAISDGWLCLRTEKTGEDVGMPLSCHLLRQLEEIEGSNPEYFFWSGNGRLKSCIGNWQRALKHVFRFAGVPTGCAHRFRHSFAKRCLLAEVPPYRVAILMGHSNDAILQKHYAKWIPERQKQLDADVRNVQRKFGGYSLDRGTNGLQL
jgi:integrase/recombinase XerD